jgi:hypothetical protein
MVYLNTILFGYQIWQMMVKLYFMDEIEEKLFGRAWGRVSSLKKLERFEFWLFNKTENFSLVA